MKPIYSETAQVREPREMAPDRVDQLLEERGALMAKVREIDEQMSAIMAMCEKWQEMTRIMR